MDFTSKSLTIFGLKFFMETYFYYRITGFMQTKSQ